MARTTVGKLLKAFKDYGLKEDDYIEFCLSDETATQEDRVFDLTFVATRLFSRRGEDKLRYDLVFDLEWQWDDEVC